MKDDLFHYGLIFRKNRAVENWVQGWFEVKECYHGRYESKGALLIFSKVPKGVSFLSDTLLIDLKQRAIFIVKDAQDNFEQ